MASAYEDVAARSKSPAASSRPTTASIWPVSDLLTLRYEIDGAQPSPRELRAPPARKPTDESAQHESDLGRERNVAGHADEDAERQADHGPYRDRGSGAHVCESTFAPAGR